ncbi:S26 family signal peptidase [Halostella litorea]|uniref:S26 family signal peptidase n=1 Tax=Halostella litorea TaxID=2528831 RepID=UPI001093019A|nr:S26 family signal peptidase [Halostella litorea]
MTDAGTGDEPDRDPPDGDDPAGDGDGGPEPSPDTAPAADAGSGSDADAASGERADAATADADTALAADEERSRRGVASDGSPSNGTDGDGPPTNRANDDGPDPREEPVTWFLKSDNEGVAAVRDLLSTVALVALVGLVLFAVSGIWPPLVAVESGSMEPHMEKNDLVFIVDEGRFAGDGAVHGVVTYQRGQETGVRSFGSYGDVIVFEPDGSDGVPIIHRARFYVEEDEEWVDRANAEYLRGDTCEEVRNCPAPHDGFITKGDATPYYDQVAGRTTVVKSEWIKGRAEVRVPWLGWVRLQFAKL